MCVPLRHRCSGHSHGSSIKTTIKKEVVEQILSKKTYSICQWKRSRCRIYRDCDVPVETLLLALKDDTTKVSVANTSREEYLRGYRTIMMDAPSLKAKVIFRIKI